MVSISASIVTQTEFGRLMNVSRQAVGDWKRQGKIVMVGKKVNVAASRARLLKHSKSKTKSLTGAQRLSVSPLETTGAVYDPPINFGNPANLPTEAVAAATAIEDGAATMARIIARHLPLDTVRALVGAWINQQRGAWVGGDGLPESIAECDGWPVPIGFSTWRGHPLFADLGLTDAEWAEIAETPA